MGMYGPAFSWCVCLVPVRRLDNWSLLALILARISSESALGIVAGTPACPSPPVRSWRSELVGLEVVASSVGEGEQAVVSGDGNSRGN